MTHVCQIIDAFKNSGKTVFYVWDYERKNRQRVTYSGDRRLRVGEMFRYETDDQHNALFYPLSDEEVSVVEKAAIVPVTHPINNGVSKQNSKAK